MRRSTSAIGLMLLLPAVVTRSAEAQEPAQTATPAEAAAAQAPVSAPAPPPSAAPTAPAMAPAEARQEGPILDLGDEEPVVADAAAEPASDDGYGRRKQGNIIERTQSDKRGVTLGGYGEHELMAGRDETTQFRAHRFIVFVFGRISENITTSTEIEFEFAGSPLKKDGVLGPGEVLLEFSVLDIEFAEWLVLRGGVILMPVGSYNLNHDAPSQDLTDRPIAYTTVVPSTWFESGAGFHGEFQLPSDHTLTYELYVVNGLDARIDDGTGMRGARGSHFEDNNSDKGIVGRVAWRPRLGSELGLSGYSGAYDKRGNRVNMANVDAKLRFGALELQAEAVYAQIDSGYVEGFSASSPANTREAVPEGMWGFYAQTNFHFRIAPLTRLLPEDFADNTFTAMLRYEARDTDVDHDTVEGDARRLTLGLNFRPIEQVVLKNDFQWNSRGRLGGGAPDLWHGGFWDDRAGGFLFDRFMASFAWLY